MKIPVEIVVMASGQTLGEENRAMVLEYLAESFDDYLTDAAPEREGR